MNVMDEVVDFKVNLYAGIIGFVGFVMFCVFFWDSPIFKVVDNILPFVAVLGVMFIALNVFQYKRVRKMIKTERMVLDIYDSCTKQGKDVKYIEVERDLKGNVTAASPVFEEDHQL